MPETPLEYDQIIWTVFSVGVISSVVILYNVISGNIKDYELLALTLGFTILVYSFFLVRGYNWKKNCLLEIYPNKKLRDKINSELYFRTRWIGETILGLIGIYYVSAFGNNELWALEIPLIITFFFAFLSLVANNHKK